MKKTAAISLTFALFAGCPSDDAERFDPCHAGAKAAFEHTLACYRQTVENLPSQYAMTEVVTLPGVEKRGYRLISQSWSPGRLVQPAEWQHDVDIYLPADPLRRRALLIANNGVRHGTNGASPAAPTDFPAETLAEIARRTRTIVVSVSDVPNQFLIDHDDGKARAEDDAVAHSWTLFMRAPAQRPTMPLHVPMMASLSRAMTLAERELAPLGVQRFIVSGISKRAWAAWLAAVADPRVDAAVPFAADMLDTRALLQHVYLSYGGNWPIAFGPYYAEHIDTRMDTREFSSLMQIEDPLQYLGTRYGARLEIPKYIVNASGDDFFVPDGAGLYIDRLPGSKALRMVPNASHGGIRDTAFDALVGFTNRLQRGQSLPQIHTDLRPAGHDAIIAFRSSERPQSLRLWSASNRDARDFRFACGIRYHATPIDAGRADTIQVPVRQPDSGWSAYFVEASYADGFVATSRTFILGKTAFPTAPPPGGGPACRTLPGRGFLP